MGDINNTRKEELIEKVSDIIANPESIAPEELDALLKDSDFIDIYRNALLLQSATLDKVDIPDFASTVAKDVKDNHTHTSRRFYTTTMAIMAAAACLLALFLISKPDKEDVVVPEGAKLVYKANTEEQNITIGNSKGEMDLGQAQKNNVAKVKDNEIILNPKLTSSNAVSTIVTVPQGKVACVRLEDGTRVWLNAQSRILFPEKFSKTERRVRIEGEVCFDVTRQPDRPFIVEFGDNRVTVLGTVFNIRSYDNEVPQVTLVSGSVCVDTPEKRMIMQPDNLVEIHDGGKLVCTNVNAQENTDWIAGHLYMEKKSLRDVMIEIGRQYNKNIIFLNDEHQNDIVHFCIERSWTLTEVINVLNDITDANIQIKDMNLEVR